MSNDSQVVLQFAVALHHGLISDFTSLDSSASDQDLLRPLSNLNASARNWLSNTATDLLRQHQGRLVDALASLNLTDDLRAKLLRCADEDVTGTLSQASTPVHDQSGEIQRWSGDTAPVKSADGESGRFEILHELGRGGLGVVYAARDRQLRRTVAVKKLQPHLRGAGDAAKQFTFEAEVIGELQHPAIAPIYALETDADGSPSYAMRYIEGISLAEHLKHVGSSDSARHNKARFSRQEFRDILSRFNQVIHATQFAHEQGIIHRDIKPANIMLGDHGETFLVDWGLAYVLKASTSGTGEEVARQDTLIPHAAGDPDATHIHREVDERLIVGTPAYMSPEQARGDQTALRPQTDVYSLGATLFSILTLSQPWRGISADEIVQRLQRNEVPVPREIVAIVPPGLDAICRKAMTPHPEDRYGAANELREDIDRWLSDEPIRAMKSTTAESIRRLIRKRFPVFLTGAIGAVICLALLAGGMVLLSQRNRELSGLNVRLTVAERIAREEGELASVNYTRAQRVVDDFFLQVAEHPALKDGSSGSQEFRRALLEKARTYCEELIAETPANDESRSLLISAHEKLTLIYDEFGLYERCRDAALNAMLLIERSPRGAETDELRATFLNRLGVSQSYLGDRRAAVESLQESVAIRERLVAKLADPLIVRNMTRTKASLALVQMELGQLADAEKLMSDNQVAVENLSDPGVTRIADQEDFLQTRLNRAIALTDMGRTGEAIALLEQGAQRAAGLAELNPQIREFRVYNADFHQDLAINLISVGRSVDAEPMLNQAILIRRALIKEGQSDFRNDLYLSTALKTLAELLLEQGSVADSRAAIDEAVGVSESLLNERHSNVELRGRLAGALMSRAQILVAVQEIDAADRDYQTAINLLRESIRGGEVTPNIQHELAQLLHNHANLLLDTPRHSAAREKFDEAATLIRSLANGPSPSIAVRQDYVIILRSLGRLLASTKAGDEGENLMKASIEAARLLYEDTGLFTHGRQWAWGLNELAAIYTNSERAEKGTLIFRESVAAWESFPETFHSQDRFISGFGGTLVNGSDALRITGQLDEARAWLDRADKLMEAAATRQRPDPVTVRFRGFGRRQQGELLMMMARNIVDNDPQPDDLQNAVELAMSASGCLEQKSAVPFDFLAMVYERQGKTEEAIRAVESALPLATPIEQKSLRERLIHLQRLSNRPNDDAPEDDDAP